MVKWLLYIIGIILILMGILGAVNWPIAFTPAEPIWHVALKIIVGIVAIWGGTQVSD
ncbi:MAG: hypothetical protein ACP5C3_09310 [Methanomicrobiales archaeon]